MCKRLQCAEKGCDRYLNKRVKRCDYAEHISCTCREVRDKKCPPKSMHFEDYCAEHQALQVRDAASGYVLISTEENPFSVLAEQRMHPRLLDTEMEAGGNPYCNFSNTYGTPEFADAGQASNYSNSVYGPPPPTSTPKKQFNYFNHGFAEPPPTMPPISDFLPKPYPTPFDNGANRRIVEEIHPGSAYHAGPSGYSGPSGSGVYKPTSYGGYNSNSSSR